jgi:hypothetical protein
MPKLDGTHLVERLQKRLDDLRAGKEIAARDLRALLTDEQSLQMDAAWTEQQALRKIKRARTKEEEIALGWKTKRDIHIETYEAAIKAATEDELDSWLERSLNAEVRQGRVYFETLNKELESGKDLQVAKSKANNALTAAKLKRMDSKAVRHISKRDKEVLEMEQKLTQLLQSQLIPEDLEQIELLKNHQKTVATRKTNQK